jgi:hypothetical protein
MRKVHLVKVTQSSATHIDTDGRTGAQRIERDFVQMANAFLEQEWVMLTLFDLAKWRISATTALR